MVKISVFTKSFQDKNIGELVDIAHENGFDSYDFCVRDGFPVNPQNVETALKEAAATFRKEGIDISIITAQGDLLQPSDARARPILSSMDRNGIRHIKLGYFSFDPYKDDYWGVVEKARLLLEGWEKLAREYNVKICYHTHNGFRLGLNCASLMHLIRGFDPKLMGAYIDTCHMVLEGESFPAGLAMTRDYLSIVALKDVILEKKAPPAYGTSYRVVPAGDGMVDWDSVLETLAAEPFEGPCSVHCEFKADKGSFEEAFKREVSFFRDFERRKSCQLNPAAE